MMLLFCVSAITSCGASPTATTVLQPSPQSTRTTYPFYTTVKTLDREFAIALGITPNHPGTNEFTVHVLDTHTGKPVTPANITLYTTMQDMLMGTDSIVMHANKQGQCSAASDNLSMKGHWAIGIIIQPSDHSIHKAGVSLITS